LETKHSYELVAPLEPFAGQEHHISQKFIVDNSPDDGKALVPKITDSLVLNAKEN